MAAISISSGQSYDSFAYLYSRTIAEDFCRKWMPVYRHLLTDQLPSNAHLLDVCCGSGQFAREFRKLGFRVTGLDTSSEMIHLARSIVPEANFLVADARSFSVPQLFDGAMSAFNSLAHVPDQNDLVAVFTSVRRSLKPGACFCFDLSMEEAYRARWRGEFSIAIDHALFTVKPSYDPAARIASNEIFLHGASGTEHQSVTILQYCHSENEVYSAARAAGFVSFESYDAQEDLALQGDRGHRFFRLR